MIKKKVVLLLVLSFAMFANAQVAMKLHLNQTRYLPYEGVYSAIVFKNFSGVPLIFGDKATLKAKLTFHIIGPDNRVIPPYDEKKAIEFDNLLLMPSESAKIEVTPSDYYPLNKNGRYKIKAIISHPKFSQAYESDAKTFSIINGFLIFDKIVGAIDYLDTKQPDVIKTRHYKLFSYHNGFDQIYSVVVDDDKYVYSVTKVGYELGVIEPIAEIDSLNNLHLLIQVTPKMFQYAKFNISGKQITRKVYTRVSPIGLVKNPKTGLISVVGGEIANPDNYNDKGLPFDD